METDWIHFLELAERLQLISPELAALAVRYGRGEDRQVREEVERELA